MKRLIEVTSPDNLHKLGIGEFLLQFLYDEFPISRIVIDD
jgi:hypothetical protein